MTLGSYGVVVGTLNHFKRENPDDFGKYYHGFIYLDTPAGQYECAVDVATPGLVKVEFRTVPNLKPALFDVISTLANGFHLLPSSPTSGALDYVRSPLLHAVNPADGTNPVVAIVESAVEVITTPWLESTGDNALDKLEELLTGSSRVFVFGEPYSHGRGVHNVHMNQGDPPGIHQQDDGIWQDGGTVIEQSDGSLTAFLTKFSTQHLKTDDNGLPL